MRRNLIGLVLFGVATAVAAIFVGNAGATPSIGFSGTTVAIGRFGEIDVFRQVLVDNQISTHVWLSMQKTKGISDAYVQSNVWQPGGDTGWHSHPGHSLIIVTAGTLIAYEGGDPACTPHVYSAGMGFVDEGGDHVHIIRNEGSVQASTIAFQVIPAGAPRRIDAPAPGNCPF